MVRNVQQQIERIIDGDRAAAAWLYDRFAPNLFRRLAHRYAYPNGLNPEDLLQDAFVFFLQNDYRVLRNFLDRFSAADQTESRLERYLWDLACGVATNRVRSHSLHKSYQSVGTEDVALEPLAERQSIDRDRLARLDGCLEGSGPRVYLYYKMRYYDGCSPEEISRITGWPKRSTYELRQTLNKWLERCRKKLGMLE